MCFNCSAILDSQKDHIKIKKDPSLLNKLLYPSNNNQLKQSTWAPKTEKTSDKQQNSKVPLFSHFNTKMSSTTHHRDAPVVQYVNFNQTGSCVSVGTNHGIKIFNCDPFGKFYSSSSTTHAVTDPHSSSSTPTDGGYGIVEMLFNTSLLAVVGLGEEVSLSPRKLKLVNTKRQTCICEITFPTAILSVRMNKSRLVVLLQAQIYIYDITNMKLLHTIETSSNPNGLIDVSNNIDNFDYLVYSSSQKLITSEVKDHSIPARRRSFNNNSTISLSSSFNSSSSPPSSMDTIQEQQQQSTQIITSNGTSSNLHKDIFSTSSDTRIVSVSNQEYNGSSGSTTNTSGYTGSETAGSSNSTASVNGGNNNSSDNSGSNNNNAPISKNGDVIIFNLKTLQPIMVIEAHKGEIAALSLNHDGTLLATASDRGTIIRVFSTETGNKEYQFRRGTYKTRIHSLTFNSTGQFLACTSSSRTVHVFKLSPNSATSGRFTNDLHSSPSQQSLTAKMMHKNKSLSTSGSTSSSIRSNHTGHTNFDESDAESANIIDEDEEEDEDEDEEEEDHNLNVDNGEVGKSDNEDAVGVETGDVEEREKDIQQEEVAPVVDSSRSTMARMIRKSSQKLQRKAAKTLGQYFPQIRVASILEPSRHFASLKVPNFDNLQHLHLTSAANNDVLIFDNMENPAHIGASSSPMNNPSTSTLSNNNNNSNNNAHINSINLRLQAAFGEKLIDIDIRDYPEMLKYKRTAATHAPEHQRVPSSASSSNNTNNVSPITSNSSRASVKAEASNFIKVLPIYVISTEGFLYKYLVDPDRGGDGILVSQYSLLYD